MSVEAVTWEQVQIAWEDARRAWVNEYVKRVNAHLLGRGNRCPAGHWMLDNVVPWEYRKEVAERFAKAGWKVSYDDRHFNFDVPDKPPSDGPYR